jgi:hypothetical protein
MSAESRWLRLNANWMRSEWLFVLSAESRLAWIQLLCYVKTDGTGGKVKAISPMVFARSNFIGEESVAQMLAAAKQDGALSEDGGSWTVTNWKQYQESESAERVRRHRAKASDCNVTAVTSGYPVTRQRQGQEKRETGGEERSVAPRKGATRKPAPPGDGDFFPSGLAEADLISLHEKLKVEKQVGFRREDHVA